MYKEFFEAQEILSEIISEASLNNHARMDNVSKYLAWLKKQHIIYAKEALPLNIPQKIFKNKISSFEYRKNEKVLCKYYYESDGSYIKMNIEIGAPDDVYLLKNMILVPGAVVWIEFGFNAGCEFGGFHPGIILRRLGDALMVVPLSTTTKVMLGKNRVAVNNIFGFKERERFADITRVRPASILRVDLFNTIGWINRKKLNEVTMAIVNYWQKNVT